MAARIVVADDRLTLPPGAAEALARTPVDAVGALPLGPGHASPSRPHPTARSVRAEALRRIVLRRAAAEPAVAETVADGWLAGAAVALDDAILREVGGLDPRYRTAWAMADLCERLAAVRPALRLVVVEGPAAPNPLARPHLADREWLRDASEIASGRAGRSWRATRVVLRLLTALARR